MKISTTINKSVLFIMLFFIADSIFAQVINLQTNFTNRYGRLNPLPATNATALGIGTFTSPNDPDAALHVNTNGLVNTWYGAGEVFRTNGPSLSLNAWRLFTGAGNGTERFALFTLPNSSIINLRATDATGQFVFQTLNREKFRITDDATDQIFAFQNTGTTGLFLPQNNAKFNIHDRSISDVNFETEFFYVFGVEDLIKE